MAFFASICSLAGCTSDGQDPALLYRVDWFVQSVTVGPDSLVVADDERVAVVFDGGGRFSLDGCNDSSGKVTVTRTRVERSGQSVGTAKGCQGAQEELDHRLLELLEGSDWSISGESLLLEGGGIKAQLEKRGLVWPREPDHVLVREDDARGAQYRLGWSGKGGRIALDFDGRLKPYGPWGRAGSVVEKYGGTSITPFFQNLPGAVFAFGDVSMKAERVEFRADDGGDPVTLELFELPNRRQIYFGRVEPAPVGRLVALDAEGDVLGRSRRYEPRNE